MIFVASGPLERVRLKHFLQFRDIMLIDCK